MKYISLDGLKRAFEQIVNYVKAQIKSNVTDKLGVASGIATLGTDGKLTSGQLPSIDKTYVGLGNVTNEAQIPLSQKGVASGVATLGTDGRVPSSQLPSYVDDVLEYTNLASFPTTGETGKIYIDLSTNKTYRWGSTTYVEISASLALGETSSTAYAGDKGAELSTKVSELETNLEFYVGGSMNANSLKVDQTGVNNVNIVVFNANMSLNTATSIKAATTSFAGVMSAADKTKLDEIVTATDTEIDAIFAEVTA